MYKIRYYYSALAKQFFIGTIVLNMLARLILFYLGGFYKNAYIGFTIAFYVIVFAACAFFFVAWKTMYFEFDEERIVKHNLLTRKNTELDLNPVKRALFSRSGVSLFYENEERPRFYIPFRYFGIISPVGVENFMNLMKNHWVHVEQEYKVLPGYDEKSKWFSRGYVILSIAVGINAFYLGFIDVLLVMQEFG